MGLFWNSCPKCTRWIARTSKFCKYCGQANDSGWVKCWSCRESISPAGRFCTRCGVDQEAQRATPLQDGRWPRQDEDIAYRAETEDMEGFLSKGLDVEQGTQAAVFQHGKLAGVVGPGRYTADSLFQRILNLQRRVRTSVVLFDASDLELVVDTDGLRTADGFEIAATYKVVLRLFDAAPFVENLFKGRRTLKRPDLAERISDELRGALKAVALSRPLDGLFESPDARTAVEEALRKAIAPVLSRYGLALTQIAFIDFFSPDREALADQRGALARALKEGDVDLERLRLGQRLRRATTQEKMDAFSGEKEFEGFVRRTEHELGLKDVIQADEMARLKERFAADRDKEGLLRRIEIDAVRGEAGRDEARKALLADEEKRNALLKGELERKLSRETSEVETARLRAEIARVDRESRRLTDEADHEEALRAVALREANLKAQREHERETLEIRSKATAEALLSILDGPAAERVARLAELERKKNLAPDALFALAASADPETARAYARERNLRDAEALLQKQEAVHAGYADRMERMMRTAMEQMGRVAESRVAGPAVAGLGIPAVGARPCPRCSGLAAPGSAFCPHCGNRMA